MAPRPFISARLEVLGAWQGRLQLDEAIPFGALHPATCPHSPQHLRAELSGLSAVLGRS
jgi:hypothetical protein